MFTKADLDEYLAEIRNQVCANCVERPPGGPPCEPLGKMCGVEQNLPDLINVIHGVHSGSIESFWECKRRQVCDLCSFQHSRYCPCPVDYLLVLVLEAVEAVDARCKLRQKGRQPLPGLGVCDETEVREIRRTFEEVAGTWTGCDWPTRFFKSALDLNGCTAAEARKKVAESKDGVHAADWQAAAEWLAKIEQIAREAEEHAARALRAASDGAWLVALDQARLAWMNEYATGRMVWRGFPMSWQRLYLAVEAAVANHSNATQTEQAAISPATQADGDDPSCQCEVNEVTQ